MGHGNAILAIERTLRILRENNNMFGGVIFVVMGDFRQITPVVPRGSRGQIVRATVVKTSLWKHVNTVHLTTNMRVRTAIASQGDGCGAACKEWSDYLLRIGDGKEPTIRNNLIQVCIYPMYTHHKTNLCHIYMYFTYSQVPEALLLPDTPSGSRAGVAELLTYTFGSRLPSIGERPDTSSTVADRDRYSQKLKSACEFYKMKAVMAPQNKHVAFLNKKVMDMLEGTEYEYCSADSVQKGANDRAFYPTEFLNTLDMSGMPPHKLRLKVGAVVMLLRNLDRTQGLCNGTRFILTKAGTYTLEGIVITAGRCVTG